MSPIPIIMDGRPVEAAEGSTILQAAAAAGIYIPALCSHPDLGPARETLPSEAVYLGEREVRHRPSGDGHVEGCRLCLVSVAGEPEPLTACSTPVRPGMEVATSGPELKRARQRSLARILANHPHACLTCAQSLGCSREPCSTNVDVAERCCVKFHRCELQRLAEYIGIPAETPRYRPRGLPLFQDDPLLQRDPNLCIGCLRCVRACRDLRGVDALGFVVDGAEIVVGTRRPGLADSACRFCTACVEVCPTGALLDRRGLPRDREAELVPCRHACPAGTDVPAYVRLVGEGRFAEAHAVIRRRVPFPGVLGYVCFHPCEDACRRGDLGEPISICALKRQAYDSGAAAGLWAAALPAPAPSGRSTAVVGAGPAGLTAAYCLARQGHRVTVFESRPVPGGMLRWGIPAHRLPATVVEDEVAAVTAQGVEIRNAVRIGRDLPLGRLLAEYDAVILAVGAGRSRRIRLEGEGLPGVHWALEFLARAAGGEAPRLAGPVVVIGGGGVAVDAAMTARRLGATEVRMVCLEAPGEMPAHDWEVALAREEEVAVENGWGPARILGEGRVEGVELVRCLSVFDAGGKFSPRYDDAQRRHRAGSAVILAVGQEPELELLDGLEGARRTPAGTVEVRGEDSSTPVPRLFACGDAVSGPTSVIQAIAQGRRAAAAVDRFLGGSGDLEEALIDLEPPAPRIGRREGFASLPRAPMPCSAPEARLAPGLLVALGLGEEAARAEGQRCLQCDLRLAIRPAPLPPEKWRRLADEELIGVPSREGVYTLRGEEGKVLAIAGTPDLRRALGEKLAAGTRATHFSYEEDPLYTRRESELIQQHLQACGEMPGAGGGEEGLDDLF